MRSGMMGKRRGQGTSEVAYAFRKAGKQARHKTKYDQDATRYQAAHDLVGSKHAKIISQRVTSRIGVVASGIGFVPSRWQTVTLWPIRPGILRGSY